MKNKLKVSHSMLETLKLKTSPESVEDLKLFIDLVETLRNRVSKQTHYHNLDEWTKPTFGFIHDMLKKYGFINGEPEINKLNKDATFWYGLNSVVSNITYSPLLETSVSLHHSSAFERNEALYKELLILKESLTK